MHNQHITGTIEYKPAASRMKNSPSIFLNSVELALKGLRNYGLWTYKKANWRQAAKSQLDEYNFKIDQQKTELKNTPLWDI